jgi:putative sterol carrier protein
LIVTDPITELKKRFNPDAAKNVSATYLLQITGQGGGNFLAKIDAGKLDVEPFKGTSVQDADCTISVSVEDLGMIMSGKISAMTAALSGILSVDGSLGLAMQLVPIFFEGQQPNIF